MEYTGTLILYIFIKVKSNKEKQFLDTIDDGIKTLLDFDTDDMVPHFIYCSGDYLYSDILDFGLDELILSRMEMYGLQSTILTTLSMYRRNLITKEKSKAAYQGKLKNERDGWYKQETSINDDLESFFNNLEDISSLEEIKKEAVESFFLPKLTEEKLELVERKDEEHMFTYLAGFDADVDTEEMKKSDSKDKYLHSWCERKTRVLNLDDNLPKNSC